MSSQRDLDLPDVIEFSELDPPPSMETFLEVSREGYDIAYAVNPRTDQQPVLRLITPDHQVLVFHFNRDAHIAIRGFFLYFNPSHVQEIRANPCNSESGKHTWVEQNHFRNLIIVFCTNCNRMRFLMSATLMEDWRKNGIIHE